MFTVLPPPGVNPIAVNKYIISYIIRKNEMAMWQVINAYKLSSENTKGRYQDSIKIDLLVNRMCLGLIWLRTGSNKGLL